MPTRRFLKVWGVLASFCLVLDKLARTTVTPVQLMSIIAVAGLVAVALSFPVRKTV